MTTVIRSKGWVELDDTPDYREDGQRFPMLRAEVREGGDTYTYMIPEAWIIGYTRRGGQGGPNADTADAVRHWHEQALLAERAA